MNEQTPKQQAVELIKKAQRILAVSHKNPDGDALGSLVALKIALEKIGKKVTIACGDKPVKLYSFLPEIDKLEDKVDASKDFVISLALDHAKVEKLGYRKSESGDGIDILVTPKDGQFENDDVTVKGAGASYDLIIIVDTPNLERLGSLAQPADIFYEIPVVNIDHHPSNENFGQVNWVELVATSTCELMVSLLEALGGSNVIIDQDIATALLTGLIYDTSSFQNVNTTPKALTIAAQLVASGARQQEIVRNLYKTKSLETLKLWGLVLSNVKEDKMHRFLWSKVTKEEVAALGADESSLSGVIDELLKSATDVDFVVLLSERDGSIHGSLRSIAKGFNVSQIAQIFGGGGHEVAAAFRIEGLLKEKEDELLMKIRDFQNKETVNKPKITDTPEQPDASAKEKPEEDKKEEEPEKKEEKADGEPQEAPVESSETEPEVEKVAEPEQVKESQDEPISEPTGELEQSTPETVSPEEQEAELKEASVEEKPENETNETPEISQEQEPSHPNAEELPGASTREEKILTKW